MAWHRALRWMETESYAFCCGAQQLLLAVHEENIGNRSVREETWLSGCKASSPGALCLPCSSLH
jgi:hypothetical protein